MTRAQFLQRATVGAGSVAIALIGLGATALAVSGSFDVLIVALLLGGVVTAIVLARTNAMRGPLPALPDPFARDAFSIYPVNFAHVRVAGVGGACLLVITALMTLQYPLATAVVLAGLLGGAIGGGALILWRRRG
jgi:hypothetical protein